MSYENSWQRNPATDQTARIPDHTKLRRPLFLYLPAFSFRLSPCVYKYMKIKFGIVTTWGIRQRKSLPESLVTMKELIKQTERASAGKDWIPSFPATRHLHQRQGISRFCLYHPSRTAAAPVTHYHAAASLSQPSHLTCCLSLLLSPSFLLFLAYLSLLSASSSLPASHDPQHCSSHVCRPLSASLSPACLPHVTEETHIFSSSIIHSQKTHYASQGRRSIEKLVCITLFFLKIV